MTASPLLAPSSYNPFSFAFRVCNCWVFLRKQEMRSSHLFRPDLTHLSFHWATKCRASWISSLRTPRQLVVASKKPAIRSKGRDSGARPKNRTGSWHFFKSLFCCRQLQTNSYSFALRLVMQENNFCVTYFGKSLWGFSLTGGGEGLRGGSFTLVGGLLLMSFCSGLSSVKQRHWVMSCFIYLEKYGSLMTYLLLHVPFVFAWSFFSIAATSFLAKRQKTILIYLKKPKHGVNPADLSRYSTLGRILFHYLRKLLLIWICAPPEIILMQAITWKVLSVSSTFPRCVYVGHAWANLEVGIATKPIIFSKPTIAKRGHRMLCFPTLPVC